MAYILNSSFSNVFTNENNIAVPSPLKIFQGSNEEKLIITEIQTHEVRKYLQKLDPNKSTDPDDISPRVLKKGCVQLENPITLLFNKSLSKSEYPVQGKRQTQPRSSKKVIRNKL